MTNVAPVVLALCLLLPVAGSSAEPEEVAISITIDLVRLDARDAATLLRTMAGVRSLEITGERQLRLRDTSERLAAALAAVELAEQPGESFETPARYSAADGTFIVSVQIKRARVADVMTELRAQIRVKNVAASQRPTPAIMVRDSPEQVEAALRLIGEMERATDG